MFFELQKNKSALFWYAIVYISQIISILIDAFSYRLSLEQRFCFYVAEPILGSIRYLNGIGGGVCVSWRQIGRLK